MLHLSSVLLHVDPSIADFLTAVDVTGVKLWLLPSLLLLTSLLLVVFSTFLLCLRNDVVGIPAVAGSLMLLTSLLLLDYLLLLTLLLLLANLLLLSSLILL
jgi:hypothetical protein